MPVRTLSCLIVVFALAGASAAGPAQAASANADASQAPAAKTAKKSNAHSVRFVKNPNQETTAERERRFKRECKGMPNAGACLGYAS